jgi:hypothetical protein
MAFASFLTWLKLPGNILIVHDNAAIDDCTRLPIDEKEHEAFSRWANSSADRLPDHLSLVPSSSTARRLDNHGSKRRDLDLGSNHDLSPRFPNLNLPARNTSYVVRNHPTTDNTTAQQSTDDIVEDEKQMELFSRWENSSADHCGFIPADVSCARGSRRSDQRLELDASSNHDLSPKLPKRRSITRMTIFTPPAEKVFVDLLGLDQVSRPVVRCVL